MPPKSDRERAAAYRKRKGDALQEKERLRSKERRRNMTEADKEKHRSATRMSARRKESRGPISTSTTSAAIIPYKSRSSEQKAIFKATRTSYQLLQTSVTSMLLKAYTTATYSTIHRNLMYE